MKQLYIIISMAITMLFMTACSNEAPNCTDSETKDLVIEIANDELVKSLGKKVTNTIEMSVDNIRTTDVNEKVGSFECAADLTFKGPGGSKSIPIQYTSELANGGDEFYVNVYGL